MLAKSLFSKARGLKSIQRSSVRYFSAEAGTEAKTAEVPEPTKEELEAGAS